MSLSTLQRLVSAAGSEASEKNAIVKHLATHGHRRMPSTSTSRNGRMVVRAYLWRDTPLGNVALVSGPSVKGRVYIVEPVNRDVHEDEIDIYLPPSAGRPAYVSFKRNQSKRRFERAQAARGSRHTPWGYEYNYRNNPEQHQGMVKVPLRRAVLYVPAEDIEGLEQPIDVTETPVEPPTRAPAPPRITPPARPRVTAPVARSRSAYPAQVEPTYAGILSFLQCNVPQAYSVEEIDRLTGSTGRDARSGASGLLKALAKAPVNPLVENIAPSRKTAQYRATVEYQPSSRRARNIGASVRGIWDATASSFPLLNYYICQGSSESREEIVQAVSADLDRMAPPADLDALLIAVDRSFAAGTFGLARLLQTIGFERYPGQFAMWVPKNLAGNTTRLGTPVQFRWGNGTQTYNLYGVIIGNAHSAPGTTKTQRLQQARIQNGNTKGVLVRIDGVGQRPAVPDVPPEIVKPAAPKPTPVVTRPAPPKPITTPVSRAAIAALEAVIDAVAMTGDEDAAYAAIEAASDRVVNAVHLSLTGKARTGKAAREGLENYVAGEYNAWQDQQEPEPEPEPVIIPPVVDPSAQRPGESKEAWLDRLMDMEEAPSAPAPAPVPAPAAPSRADELRRIAAERAAARAAARSAGAEGAAPSAPAAQALTPEEKARQRMAALLKTNPGYHGLHRVRRNASLDPEEFNILLAEAESVGFTRTEAQGFMDMLVQVLAGLPDSTGAAKIFEKFDGLVGIYRDMLAEQTASAPAPAFEPEPSISPEEADRVIRKIMAEEAAKMKKEAQSATQRPAQKRPAQKRKRALPAGPPSSIPQTPQSIPQPIDPSAQRPGESKEAWLDRLMDME